MCVRLETLIGVVLPVGDRVGGARPRHPTTGREAGAKSWAK
jgi:hypothetical protein